MKVDLHLASNGNLQWHLIRRLHTILHELLELDPQALDSGRGEK